MFIGSLLKKKNRKKSLFTKAYNLLACNAHMETSKLLEYCCELVAAAAASSGPVELVAMLLCVCLCVKQINYCCFIRVSAAVAGRFIID